MITIKPVRHSLSSYTSILWHLFGYWLLRTGTIKSPSLDVLGIKPAEMHATISEHGIEWSNADVYAH